MAPPPPASAPLDSARLQAFLAVVREQGFSRAARALGKTQSSVSQAVAQLEQDLGERLFDRIGRGAALTEAGRLLVAHVERIFSEMDEARAHLGASRALETGELVIGTSDTLALYVLPPLLAAFRAKFPGVDLRLDNRPSPATAVAVSERRVHVGVVSLPLPASDLGDPSQARIAIEALAPQADVLICPPSHRLTRTRPLTLAALAGEPLLLLDRSTGSRAFIDAAFAARGVHPRVTMEMSSVEVLKRLVALGFGVSIVPAWAASHEAAARALVARPIADLTNGANARSIGLVTPATKNLPRATAAFVALARTELPRAAKPRPRSR